jgi:tetratricopeptide (TPR) repeat protein
MMIRRILFIFFLSHVFLYSSILIIPFENKSNRNYFWLSESISYALCSTFLEEGIDVISTEKRNSIYDELQIPLTTPITRATSIRLANMAGADKIVIGDFVVMDGKVIVSSRIIDLKNGKLGETISVEGDINELIPLQNFLSWRLLQNIKKIDDSRKDEFLIRWSKIPLPAWENFIKGLLTKDNDKKELFLLKSLNLFPEFSSCRWELSYHYFKKGDYEKCLNYIKPLIDSKPIALFISSLCHFYKKDYEKGIEGFKICLEKGIEKLSSTNNIGVCYAKKGDFEKAMEYFKIALSEEKNPDIYFNIALISNEKKEFLENIKKAIQYSRPTFQYFHSLYQKLIFWGDTEIAEIIKSISKEYFSSDIDAPINDFKDLLKAIEGKWEIPLQIEERDFYKKEANFYLKSNNLVSAESSIKKALHISPFDWESHLILSKVLMKKKDFKNAMKEISFSIWLEERGENSLEMGKLLIEIGEKTKGLEQIKKALSLDPSLEEAKEIIKKLEK